MSTLVEQVVQELETVVSAVNPADIEAACDAICGANKIMLYGCGREALQLKGFAMRLHHLGLSVSMQGDMTAPPLGSGDLFIVSAGPGELSTVTALMTVANDAGCKVLLLTAEPSSEAARLATHVLIIPAQTMASDKGDQTQSILPMGSVYEGAMFLLFELMVHSLKARLGLSDEAMRANHTNME